jgi:hypothetical protein
MKPTLFKNAVYTNLGSYGYPYYITAILADDDSNTIINEFEVAVVNGSAVFTQFSLSQQSSNVTVYFKLTSPKNTNE